MASGPSTSWRHQTSKWFVGVAQKAHIRSTSQVILSDTETTNRGVLCLAPIGRLAWMTTRSSRSCCSALRSIRQSKNVSEPCIKKNALKTTRTAASGPLGQSGWQVGTVRPFVQPASNSSAGCFYCPENGVFTSFAITPPPLAACRLVSTCQQSQAGPAIVVW
jgi:hypothetical protein